MKAFREISIKRKLIAINLLSVSVGLLLATSVFISYEFAGFRRNMASEFAWIGLFVLWTFASAELSMADRTRKLQAEAGGTELCLDRLTGLPNRTLLHEKLGACLERVSREPQCPFALLFLDLDRFQVINDSLGHVAGDTL